MTSGNEDGDGDEGSDSQPSEDNLDEDELALIVPIQKKKEEEVVKQVPQNKKKPAEPIKVESK